MEDTLQKITSLITSHLDATPEGKIPLIVILGPTAVGKTALSIGFAKQFNGEIISADSRQVYKGMDIGTDKISVEDMQGVTHHMLDVVEPDEEFSAYDFKTRADQLIPEIHARNHVPFIVGGTMLYIDAVVDNFDFGAVQPDEKLREELYEYEAEHGAEALHKKLEELNPDAAAAIHPSKVPFVVRAIEKARLRAEGQREQRQASNQSIAAHDEAVPQYYTLKIGLIRPREEIYDRINKRVDQQLVDGALEKEAKYFLEKYPHDLRSISGLGYRQFIPYFEGQIKDDGEKYSLEDVKDQLKKEIRHFAKRQLSWWKKDSDIHWVNMSDKVCEGVMFQGVWIS